MKQIKTAELTGAALDWVVAKCEGLHREDTVWEIWASTHQYSTDWALAGPIIEREKIGVTFRDERDEWEVPNWSAWPTQTDDRQEIMGETHLIAAMRCYVASKLGGTVEGPEGLC